MSEEDIVIRLKGEDAGGKALVTALRQEVDRLTASTDKNAASTKRGGDVVRDAAKGFQQLHSWLKAIAAAEVVRGLIDLGKRGIEVAVSLNKLSEQTGISVEKLSALKFAADQNETSIESLVPAFRGLSKSLQDLNSGAPEAVKAFAAIGLSAASFKGLSLDQSLKLVADKLSGYEDGAGKVAIAQQLLGRSAIELLPLLNALSGEGLANATKEAERLGLILSGATAKAADALDDKITALRASLVAFFTPSAGDLNRLTQFLTDLSAKAKDGASEMDKLGAAIQSIMEKVPLGLGAFIKMQGEVNEMLKRFDDVTSGSSTTGGATKKKLTVQDDAALALARARVQATLAGLQQEQALERENSKITEEENKAAFEKGLKSLGDYYVERRQIIFRDSQAEVAILQKQRAAVASLQTDPTKPAEAIARAQAIAAIDAQITLKKVQTTAQAIQLNDEEIAAAKKLAENIRSFETSILEARGATLEATKRNIDEEIRKDRELLQQKRTLTAEDEKQLETKRRLLTQQAEFTDITTKGGQQFSELSRDRAAVEERAREGLISQRDAQLEIEQTERDRLPVLRQIGEQMTALGVTTKDPALIEAAKQFNAQLVGMGVHVDALQVALANFKDNAIDALGNAIGNFFSSGITDILGSVRNEVDQLKQRKANVLDQLPKDDAQAQQQINEVKRLDEEISNAESHVHLLGDAFRSLALSAVQSLQQIIAQLIALQAIQALRGLSSFARVANKDFGSIISGSGVLESIGHAAGGYIRGPGTGTSDSIPAMLSAGEYVLTARATRRLGVRLLDVLNRGYTTPTLHADLTRHHVQHFAAGGLVEAGARSSTPAGFEGTLRLAPGLVMDELNSTDGTKIIIRKVVENKKTINRALDR